MRGRLALPLTIALLAGCSGGAISTSAEGTATPPPSVAPDAPPPEALTTSVGVSEESQYWTPERLKALDASKAAGADGEGRSSSKSRTPQGAAVSTAPTARGSQELRGTLLVNAYTADRNEGGDPLAGEGFCIAPSGFTDLRSGTQVLIKDEAGSTVAIGALDGGELVNQEKEYAEPYFGMDGDKIAGGYDYTAGNCAYGFIVSDVPERPFYSVEIGDRGAEVFSLNDLISRGWTVKLTVG